MKNENKTHIYKRFDELLSLCSAKGLNNDETFIIAAMTDTKEVIDRYGEKEALDMAIEVIKLCDTVDEIFYAVEKVLGFRE